MNEPSTMDWSMTGRPVFRFSKLRFVFAGQRILFRFEFCTFPHLRQSNFRKTYDGRIIMTNRKFLLFTHSHSFYNLSRWSRAARPNNGPTWVSPCLTSCPSETPVRFPLFSTRYTHLRLAWFAFLVTTLWQEQGDVCLNEMTREPF